jgi:NitT/TauT family transport system substrate-binding protein
MKILRILMCFAALIGLTSISKATESFSLAWSEYPSWSAIEVASRYGMIDGKKGKMEDIEKKWGVDIELKLMDYDACMTAYSAVQVDAVCITNMDILNPAMSRSSVAILPTSTSVGADALIVDSSITDISQLKSMEVYGLSKSVSEYVFARGLINLGLNPDDFNFTNMDPAAASTLFQQRKNGYSAIMVWNPFVLGALNSRSDARVLFSSESIPGEVLDMVVVGADSLKKTKGEDFAYALVETYYAVNEKLADPEVSDEYLIAIGEKFSNLGLKDMRTVVKQTRFYGNPADGIAVFEDPKTKETMNTIVDFCLERDIIEETPTIVFGESTAKVNLRFTSKYMKKK